MPPIKFELDYIKSDCEKKPTEARSILFKFCDNYNVDKIIACAPKLKVYEPVKMDHKYSVFISKSPNMEEQGKNNFY